MTSIPSLEPLACRRLLLRGRVQGVGLRPAVARWAASLGLAGEVRNEPAGACIEVEGPEASVARFTTELIHHLPQAARIDSIDISSAPLRGRRRFSIAPTSQHGALAAHVPPDRVACTACLQEVADPTQRRHAYPFTSCTDCGPRWSIITSMPYDRAGTTMAGFTMCDTCRHEYDDPSDRRCHAQTLACAACGPRLWCTDSMGRVAAHDQAAIETALRALAQGHVVALRGVGGYQLLADAADTAAVARLRQRKCRPSKPLAVLVPSLDAAQAVAEVDGTSRALLADAAGAIVLLPRRAGCLLAANVAAGLREVGIMLPTTPLHWQLASGYGRPLICTSGNREGEPLCWQHEEARQRLAGMAELWLEHDRPIARPIDDSVIRPIGGRGVVLRLARGLAPLPLPLSGPAACLALGGHQKAALALSTGAQAVLAAHVGDLDGLAARERYALLRDDLVRLYDVCPTMLACDLHPDYYTTQLAEQAGLPVVRVQHHHAHVAAAMLEHGWLDRRVLGVAFDGTGYGPDGSIWGGEFLVASASGFRRAAALFPWGLPGGDLAARAPWRAAVAATAAARGVEAAARLRWGEVEHSLVAATAQAALRPALAPRTTSAGRLFDAAAALVLGVPYADYEGQAAMLLEAACDETAAGAYPMPPREGKLLWIDWRPAWRALLEDMWQGIGPDVLAMRFHRGLALGIVEMCRKLNVQPVLLCGGVFQNRILTELVLAGLRACGCTVEHAARIPPGDGGLAAGQLAVAAQQLVRGDTAPCVWPSRADLPAG
jgi:hydrogenase maturation protein HypF